MHVLLDWKQTCRNMLDKLRSMLKGKTEFTYVQFFKKEKQVRKWIHMNPPFLSTKLNSIEADVPCGLPSVWPTPPRIDRIGVACWILEAMP